VARDPQLWKFVDKEEVKSLKQISTVDRGDSRRVVDLVEGTKIPNDERAIDLKVDTWRWIVNSERNHFDSFRLKFETPEARRSREPK
jgi:hypothetical protein